MQFLIISEHKMKITLQKADMEKYGIGVDTVDYDTPKCRRIFWQILDEAKQKKNFDVGEERVLLQMYPKPDGGGELFVTKLGKMAPSGVKKIEESDRVTTLKNERLTYRFPDGLSLSEAARAVSAFGGRVESDVYLDEDGGYYLTILERPEGKSRYLCLCEYGDAVPKCLEGYVFEHTTKLTDKNGIETYKEA